MQLPSDLSARHAKIDAHIASIHGRIGQACHGDESTGEAYRRLDPPTDDLGRMLRGYVQDDQRVVLDHARRVLGDSLEEVAEIDDHNVRLLACFDQVRQAIDGLDDQDDADALDELYRCVGELRVCFDRQTDAERVFYTLYSTILFPAGAATD